MQLASSDDADVSKQIQERLGNRVRQLRKHKGWTQVECAERLGLNVTYLGLLERGHKNVCLDTLETISQGFGVSVGKLMSRL